MLAVVVPVFLAPPARSTDLISPTMRTLDKAWTQRKKMAIATAEAYPTLPEVAPALLAHYALPSGLIRPTMRTPDRAWMRRKKRRLQLTRSRF